MTSVVLLCAGTGSAFLDPSSLAGFPSSRPATASFDPFGSLNVSGNYLPVNRLVSRPFSFSPASLTLGSAVFWPARPIPPTVHFRQSAAVACPASLRAGWAVAVLDTSRRQLALSRDAVIYAKAPGSIPPGETLLFAAAYSEAAEQRVRLATRQSFSVRGFKGEAEVLLDLLSGSRYADLSVAGPITSDQTVLTISSLEARPGSGAQGLGFALHGAVQLELPGGWELSGAVENALSRMWWTGLTQTEALANTSTTVTDPDGYLTVVPVVSGTERRVNRIVEFPVEPTIALSRRQGPATYRLLVDLYTDRPAFRPAVSWRLRRSTLTLSYHSLDSATTLGLVYGPATLALTTNDLDFSRATALGMTAGLVLGF
ncbi:MAG: hypothetical protein QME79_04160 [Bacillota bacterium]|nr:hypothetical protein [Bacillota bacterium]